jgi:hypothetical protein
VGVTVSSPRLDERLRSAARKLDDREQSMAETWRRVSAHAEDIGCTRPGYDTIRLLVRDNRKRQQDVRELLEPVVADFLQGRVSAWDVARVREAAALMQGSK